MTHGRHHHPLAYSAACRLELEPGDPPLRFAALFGNDRPVDVEIGHGKGAFLIAAAEALPDRNLLGIEWATSRHVYAGERVTKRGLTNARVVRGDAFDIFRTQVAERSVSVVHLYFPDPYWKKRHFKRRLVTPPFVALLARALADDGAVLLKSDVEERFAAMELCFNLSEDFERTDFERIASAYPLVASSFENKARVAGRRVSCAAWVRKQVAR